MVLKTITAIVMILSTAGVVLTTFSLKAANWFYTITPSAGVLEFLAIALSSTVFYVLLGE